LKESPWRFAPRDNDEITPRLRLLRGPRYEAELAHTALSPAWGEGNKVPDEANIY